MPYTDEAKNEMLDHLGTLAVLVSLHTADPAGTGANEVTGGSYAKQSVTWSAAATGNLDSSNQPVFDVPGGTTISHFGIWDTGGTTFYGGNALSASENFTADGTYTLTDLDLDLNAV